MKAVVLTKSGGLQNLKYTSIQTPIPKSDEVLLKVDYCGLNHLDLLIRDGKRPGPKKFPHVLGSEIVGTTRTGDIFAVYPWTFCTKCRQCLDGNENICNDGGTIGRTCWGGYAEYVVVPIRNLIKIPNTLSPNQVCASLLSAPTAYHLINRANIKDKSTVLVTGATGGVGTFAIQMLKHKKCQIICATSHLEKREKLKKLGADIIVSTHQMEEKLKKLFPTGLPYIIDMMGGKVWSEGVDLLARNGTIVFCATSLYEPGTVNIAGAFSKQVNILGSSGGRMKDLKAVIKLLQRGIITPVIDSVYPLEKAELAQKKLEDQDIFGKVLLKI